MTATWAILLLLAIWLLLVAITRAALAPWLADAPGDTPVHGVIWRLLRIYARIVHRVEFHGFEDFRRVRDVGPLIVVSNHTGAIDPLLIQAGCRFRIRWLMASEMMWHGLDWLWRMEETIPVDRDGKDAAPAREAIRHVQAGNVVGIFPEGRIVQPPEEIRPFYMGVGLIVARAQARVLLVWVSGTPPANNMVDSLVTPSRARVVFADLIDFRGERDGHVITAQLRQRLAEISGWPLNDQKMPPHERPQLAW